MAAEEREERDLNRDPISDETGAHPVGTGLGATGGAVTGAAVGSVGGPIGAAIGGIVGAVVGGLAGKAAAEAVNPTAEEAHWRENYTKQPYYQSGRDFDDYGPAYRLGVSSRLADEDDWMKLEPRLASEWERTRGSSALDWAQASPATRAAWERVDNSYRNPGSSALTADATLISAADRANPARSDMVAGGGAAAMVGSLQSAGDNSGDMADVVDILQELVECSKDGEYGFRTSAEQVKRADLQTLLLARADDCRAAAQELNQLIRECGGSAEDGGSAMGAMHRGWVAVKTALTTYDDKAVMEECERGEDNAKARYRKALEKQLPPHIRQVVERQMQGVQRNHDQVKMLRDQLRNA